MIPNLIPIFVYTSFALCGVLSAQENALPASAWNKLIRETPPSAAWRLSCKKFTGEHPGKTSTTRNTESESAGPSKAGERSLRSASYVRSGAVGHAVFDYSDNTKEECYVVNDIKLTMDPRQQKVQAGMVAPFGYEPMHFMKFYPGIEWVKAKHFVTREDFNGEACLRFHQESTESTPESGIPVSEFALKPRDAWFSEKTGLPVAFRDGDLVAIYAHQPAPGTAILLPEPFQRALNRHFNLRANETVTVTPEGKFVFARSKK